MTEHEKPAVPFCNGPINLETMRCQWCGRQYGPDDPLEPRCKMEWPDRPHKVVNPEIVKLAMRGMVITCWRCGLQARVTEAQHGQLFQVLDIPDSRVETFCSGCGAGIGLEMAKLIQLADAIALPNTGPNRRQRRVIDRVKARR